MTKSKYNNIRFWITILGTAGIQGILWFVVPGTMDDFPDWFSLAISVCALVLPALFDAFMKWKDPEMIVRLFPKEYDERAIQLKGKAAYKLMQFALVFGISYYTILSVTRSNDELFNFLAFALLGGMVVYLIILQYYKKTE